jgi:hypothetical protein
VAEKNPIESMARGLGDKDTVAAFALQEERAAVKVRSH